MTNVKTIQIINVPEGSWYFCLKRCVFQVLHEFDDCYSVEVGGVVCDRYFVDKSDVKIVEYWEEV